jgi:hypothetical protein
LIEDGSRDIPQQWQCSFVRWCSKNTFFFFLFIFLPFRCRCMSARGIISPAELKNLRRCGSFNLSDPIIYQRLWFNSNKQFRASKFVFRLPHSRCDFLEPLWFPCSDLRTENIRRDCYPVGQMWAVNEVDDANRVPIWRKNYDHIMTLSL